MGSSPERASSADPSSDEPPSWVGHWRVRRYGGAAPDVPTYYDATTDSWDVLKDPGTDLYVARHPILSVHGDVLVLKDEGEPDDTAERWRMDVEADQLRVTALTGPHAGAVGVAERVDTDPRADTDS